jgi:hypothetical protein
VADNFGIIIGIEGEKQIKQSLSHELTALGLHYWELSKDTRIIRGD